MRCVRSERQNPFPQVRIRRIIGRPLAPIGCALALSHGLTLS
jgi:hypothetical protein